MAKTAKKAKGNGSIDVIEGERVIDFNQRFPMALYNRVASFKTVNGISTEQEAIRIIVTRYLQNCGF